MTGAAGGIGSAVTRLLSAAGADVVASDLEPVDGLVSVAGDASLAETAERTVATALERFGRLDVLVNNVGVTDRLQDDRPRHERRRSGTE